MRLLRFDRQADAALRAIGFNIEENGDVAKITGHMTISRSLFRLGLAAVRN